MSPSKKDRRRAKKRGTRAHTRSASHPTATWALAFYETADGRTPAHEFLLACPQSVREMLLAIVVAVRDAPPPAFPASGMWHAMHAEMKGFQEARDEHGGQLYRLFCILDGNAPDRGLDAKVVALICGGVKRVRSPMDSRVYDEALAYRADYLTTRRIARSADVPADVNEPTA